MKERLVAMRCLRIVGMGLLLAASLNGSETYAETYISAQIGATVPSVVGNGLSSNDLTGAFNSGSTVSDQSLASSVLYGGKLGHYFKAVPWLGLEAEVYNTTPHIKQQSLTFSGPSGPIGTLEFPGLNFRVLTVAPMNLTIRYHKTRLQPYLAVGPGIFFARIKDPSLSSDNTQSSTSLGLNAQAGLRYYITRHLALFGEGKFNYTRFHFDQTPPGSTFNMFGFNGTYNMFHVSFGLTYQF